MESKYLDIGEGAGAWQHVTRQCYEGVREELIQMREKDGEAAVLMFRDRCMSGDPSITQGRKTLTLTIVSMRNDALYLRTAEEADIRRGVLYL